MWNSNEKKKERSNFWKVEYFSFLLLLVNFQLGFCTWLTFNLLNHLWIMWVIYSRTHVKKIKIMVAFSKDDSV